MFYSTKTPSLFGVRGFFKIIFSTKTKLTPLPRRFIKNTKKETGRVSRRVPVFGEVSRHRQSCSMKSFRITHECLLWHFMIKGCGGPHQQKISRATFLHRPPPILLSRPGVPCGTKNSSSWHSTTPFPLSNNFYLEKR